MDWYDYRYRFYDPQIGRFNSIDRLADKYPYKSPFDYAENDPIAAIDLDGLEKYYATDGSPHAGADMLSVPYLLLTLTFFFCIIIILKSCLIFAINKNVINLG